MASVKRCSDPHLSWVATYLQMKQWSQATQFVGDKTEAWSVFFLLFHILKVCLCEIMDNTVPEEEKLKKNSLGKN